MTPSSWNTVKLWQNNMGKKIHGPAWKRQLTILTFAAINMHILLQY